MVLSPQRQRQRRPLRRLFRHPRLRRPLLR
jgi:hypothetical protein